jgi:hypothetical protein
VARKIKDRLREQHDNLRERFCKLASKDGIMRDIRKVLQYRVSEKSEYQKVLDELSNQEIVVEEFFEILMRWSSYLDYNGLLDELIHKCGDYELKIDAEEYRRNLLTFLGHTTIKQAAQAIPPWWSARHDYHHLTMFTEVRTRILKDPASFRLIDLISCRMKFTGEIGLHQLIFFVLGIKELNSFMVSWLIPSALIPVLTDAVRSKNVISVFQAYKISSLSVMTEVTLYSEEVS